MDFKEIYNDEIIQSPEMAEEEAERIASDNAFHEIVLKSDTPVIDRIFFEEFWGNGARRVWKLLREKVAKDEFSPIEFVYVYAGEVALRGDLVTASRELDHNASGKILGKIVNFLSTENGSHILEAQGLPKDYFKN